MAITIICQIVLWIWFLGCTITYRIGKYLLVEGVGTKSAEFAVLCLYSLGIVLFHNPDALVYRTIHVPLVLYDIRRKRTETAGI